MRKMFIGFSYPVKFKVGAAAISWWTERPYSHVYLRFSYINSKDAIFHAAHGMVHFLSFANFKRDNEICKEYEIEVPDCEHDLWFDECMELAGEKYGTIELCKIFISDLAWMVCKKPISWVNGRGYICSELLGNLCVNRLGLSFDKPLFLLKPSDIDEKLDGLYPLVTQNQAEQQ